MGDGLQHQGPFHPVAQLVEGLKAELGHPLQRNLLHGQKPRAGQVLAQEHTEHGRLGRVIPHLLCQVQAGLAAAGIQVQTAAPPQQQDHLVPGGLLDLLDAAAGDLGRQLLHYALQADGV